MSYRQSIPIYVKPYSEAQTIYPLTRYKIQQIQNIIENNPEQIIPPDWNPPGYISQEVAEETYEHLQSVEIKFSYDDWYYHDPLDELDGRHLYEYINSPQGHRDFNLPDLPSDYYYHVYLISVIANSHEHVGSTFLWSLRYHISDDSYVLLKRTNSGNNGDNYGVSQCFVVNYAKLVYSSYDVFTEQATASYSNIIGYSHGTSEDFYMLDFGPNTINDPDMRYISVIFESQSEATFENSPDEVYFRVLLLPELKESLP